jgi:hypothetical protein
MPLVALFGADGIQRHEASLFDEVLVRPVMQ